MMTTGIKQKTFSFRGVDYKTEIWLGISIIPILLIVLGGCLYCLAKFWQMDLLKIPRGLIIPAILGISLFSLHWLVKLVPDRTWQAEVDDKRLTLRYGKHYYDIAWDNLRRIENMGNAALRYLSFVTKDGVTVRIRVGTGALTPFSGPEDIAAVDELIKHLSAYIDKHFNKKVLRNKIDQNPFPHYGVYVVKSEPLTYTFLQKMTPGQVILLFLTAGMLFVFLMLQLLFYYIDSKG
ncbi:hypothetical protein HGH92_06345 [Chitinophaga varians]|uniref:DUF304 domain-containing protein n=1 Tax=Chitinophaga varians TaxID=2202339 RepID=A0A847RT14_9BACT|nr:hypothetical protein [Chitinophaga varians]NLR63917.1 hypothetical protein [Chitinophaga varians]